MPKETTRKTVETLTHDEATRKNIPTAEYQSVMKNSDESPLRLAYERRNRDLDPQLVWRGKDQQDWSNLIVSAPPLYIQEKVHPKVLIDDLVRRTEAAKKESEVQIDLFSDFNGVPEGARTEFYQHEAHWTNRMILGDSLQVMASLTEREGLRGKVQCIYLDPPYGIKFNSNFQWSTTSRDVKDGNVEHITREPEQVKAFRDTWRDGIHSYLTYLRDRLIVARELLKNCGSIFMQIGEENVHRARSLLDEVFGEQNFVSQINFKTTGGAGSPTGGTETLASVNNFILWYARDYSSIKYRQLQKSKDEMTAGLVAYNKLDFYDLHDRRVATETEKAEVPLKSRLYTLDNLTSQSSGGPQFFNVLFEGQFIIAGKNGWKTTTTGMKRLQNAKRIGLSGNTLRYIRYWDDFPVFPYNNSWDDTVTAGFSSNKQYIVQTNPKVIERCILMTTDPGDLVLDPTCGSGTTAYVAEQWGRRWITIDTSRVALALARARIMGARYPYYLLADSQEGQAKEAEITGGVPSTQPTRRSLRQGFVYERVPHITLKSIANNTEIDVIWDKYQQKLEPQRNALNKTLGTNWEEWEIPREQDAKWSAPTKESHNVWWQLRIARQKEIDASISAKAEYEYLFDKPYDDKKRVRVAGPFTVESLSPHRVLALDENDELIDEAQHPDPGYGPEQDFAQMILENLRTAGVQQAHKDDKIVFISLTPWPGELICAEGRYLEGTQERRAGILIGPEFGTVNKPDLVAAAREAGDAGFDVLVACAFNYDAHSTDFSKLGRIPILK
ncbi:MAG: site-specific DNA-methyltransferase, partial [Rectinemataceae bacterium]|nr:site-specific DNA-methyltransferase [Rectinemataceae bacterium]